LLPPLPPFPDSTQTPSEIFISECSNGFNDIPYAIGAVTLSNDGNTKTRNYTLTAI
jgi:hypothetical protein